MSLIDIPGAQAVAGVSNLLSTIVDKIFPNPEDKAKAQVLLRQAEYAPLLDQVRIDLVEAAHQSVFVAGWRPFVGWVCGISFAYKFVGMPFLVYITLLIDPTFDYHGLPALDWTELSAVLFGMLGLSYHRTQENNSSKK